MAVCNAFFDLLAPRGNGADSASDFSNLEDTWYAIWWEELGQQTAFDVDYKWQNVTEDSLRTYLDWIFGQIRKDSITGLVIDLTRNGGGFDVLKMFLNRDGDLPAYRKLVEELGKK